MPTSAEERPLVYHRLAWTAAGGNILFKLYDEGNGGLVLTGQAATGCASMRRPLLHAKSRAASLR